MTPAGGHHSRDERGQVLSSLVAVAAVVAIVAGLLVLFGTRGNDSVAGEPRKKAGTPTVTVRPATPSVTPSVTPSSEPTVATPAPTVPVAERPAVEVYNNTRRRGLADQVSDKARAAGWKVAGADNWSGKIVASTVYFPAGLQVEAQALASDLGILRIKDALPNMKKDRLTVILTVDYPA